MPCTAAEFAALSLEVQALRRSLSTHQDQRSLDVTSSLAALRAGQSPSHPTLRLALIRLRQDTVPISHDSGVQNAAFWDLFPDVGLADRLMLIAAVCQEQPAPPLLGSPVEVGSYDPVVSLVKSVDVGFELTKLTSHDQTQVCVVYFFLHPPSSLELGHIYVLFG